MPLVMLGALTIYLIGPKKTGGPGGGSAGGSSSMPRGLRNNNIGNIKLNDSNPWLGKIPRAQNTDGVFEQFTSKEYGTRAMLMLLKKYYNDYDLFTIEDIISRYDKPTATNYMKFLAGKMGLTTISYIEPGRMLELAMHMAHFENGMPATNLTELMAVNKKFNIGL